MASTFKVTVQPSTAGKDDRMMGWFDLFLKHPYVHEERQDLLGKLKPISWYQFVSLEPGYRSNWVAAFCYSLRPQFDINLPIRDNVLDDVEPQENKNKIKCYQYKSSSYNSTARGSLSGSLNRRLIATTSAIKAECIRTKAPLPEFAKNPIKFNFKSMVFIEITQAIDRVYKHLQAVEKSIDIRHRRSLSEDAVTPIQFIDSTKATKATSILPFTDYVRLIHNQKHHHM